MYLGGEKMEMCERIRTIRESMKMSRAAFGKEIGVSGDTVNNLERGRIEIKEHYINLICRTFNINYFWLMEEKGDMLISPPDILLQEAVDKYELDDLEKTIVEEFVKLDKDSRKAIKNYLLKIFQNTEELH